MRDMGEKCLFDTGAGLADFTCDNPVVCGVGGAREHSLSEGVLPLHCAISQFSYSVHWD